MNIQKRIDELVDILNKATYEYYVLDRPNLTDQEYDKYLRELIDLENKHPEYAKKESPTKRVGGTVVTKFKKIKHEIPTFSLSDVFNINEVIDFDKKVRAVIQHPEYVCELKIDGLSVS